jgi:hypothetical protein
VMVPGHAGAAILDKLAAPTVGQLQTLQSGSCGVWAMVVLPSSRGSTKANAERSRVKLKACTAVGRFWLVVKRNGHRTVGPGTMGASHGHTPWSEG